MVLVSRHPLGNAPLVEDGKIKTRQGVSRNEEVREELHGFPECDRHTAPLHLAYTNELVVLLLLLLSKWR